LYREVGGKIYNPHCPVLRSKSITDECPLYSINSMKAKGKEIGNKEHRLLLPLHSLAKALLALLIKDDRFIALDNQSYAEFSME